MEVDSDLEVIGIPVAEGWFLNCGYFRIQTPLQPRW
jgi:hypothetical protein